MRTVLSLAFRNLLQARRRTLLLGLAIALVAMLFLILRSLSQSVSERMVEAATTLSSGHVNVGGFFKSRRRGADPLLLGRQKIRDTVRELVPEAESIIDRHRGWGRLISPASSINVSLVGILPQEEGRFFRSLRLAAQSEYKAGGSQEVKGNFDDLAQPHTALLFAAQAKKMAVEVGDTLTFVTEASGMSNTVDLRVVAIASDIGFMSNWSVYVPRATVVELYGLVDDTTGVVMVYLPTPARADAVMKRLHQGFADRGYTVMDHDPQAYWFKFDRIAGEDWLGQRLDLSLWNDEISFVIWITTALDFVSFLIVGILSLIIIGGMMNSMWMAVRERTKEIGTMRAMGAPKALVVRLFLLEAMLLGLCASLIGALLGYALLGGLNAMELAIQDDGIRLFLMANKLQVNLHPSQLPSVLILFTSVAGLAALYPALKAARLRPVEALQHGK